MDILEYINTDIKTAPSIDKALEILDTMCSGYYHTETPVKDHKIIKERFGVDSVLAEGALVFNVTSEMVSLVENDTLENELEKIGLDKKRFEI